MPTSHAYAKSRRLELASLLVELKWIYHCFSESEMICERAMIGYLLHILSWNQDDVVLFLSLKLHDFVWAALLQSLYSRAVLQKWSWRIAANCSPYTTWIHFLRTCSIIHAFIDCPFKHLSDTHKLNLLLMRHTNQSLFSYILWCD
jgi:hypothetical protein